MTDTSMTKFNIRRSVHR